MSIELHQSCLAPNFQLNDYLIKTTLGHGGFGITYLAEDTHLQIQVAIKEYFPNELAVRAANNKVQPKSQQDEATYQWGLKRFIDEARILARFNHPNIVRVLRFFEANDTAYFVMEYAAGRSLAEALQESGTAAEDELRVLLPPLLDGLAEVHAAGFLHRDIKPGNIYLRDRDNSPLLLDFGAARYELGSHSRSITGVITPGYAPFEQYQMSPKQQGAWTDIYALGAVLYRAISGHIPVGALMRDEVDPLEPAVKFGKNTYSKNLLQGIDWALQIREGHRPQTVANWKEILLYDGNSEHTNNIQKKIADEQPQRKFRQTYLFGALLFIVILLGVLIYIFYPVKILKTKEIPSQEIIIPPLVSQDTPPPPVFRSDRARIHEARGDPDYTNNPSPETASTWMYLTEDFTRCEIYYFSGNNLAERVTERSEPPVRDLACLRKALTLEPYNPQLLIKLDELKYSMQQIIEDALENQDINMASQSITVLRKIDPNSDLLPTFEARLAELQHMEQLLRLAQRDAEAIGRQIWQNESSGKISGLTIWNSKEHFASMGIGHFIWYPAGKEGPFTETFPRLLAFIKERGGYIPSWLSPETDCPWSSKPEFEENLHSSKMLDLRRLMQDTIPVQVQFMIYRLYQALPRILANLNLESDRTRIRQQFFRVATTPNGIYALLDYVHFKGEGTSVTERYNGHGWGLLQVLENMSLNASENAVQDFILAAKYVLNRRIENSPSSRNEGRWKNGWWNRLGTYERGVL